MKNNKILLLPQYSNKRRFAISLDAFTFWSKPKDLDLCNQTLSCARALHLGKRLSNKNDHHVFHTLTNTRSLLTTESLLCSKKSLSQDSQSISGCIVLSWNGQSISGSWDTLTVVVVGVVGDDTYPSTVPGWSEYLWIPDVGFHAKCTSSVTIYVD